MDNTKTDLRDLGELKEVGGTKMARNIEQFLRFTSIEQASNVKNLGTPYGVAPSAVMEVWGVWEVHLPIGSAFAEGRECSMLCFKGHNRDMAIVLGSVPEVIAKLNGEEEEEEK